MFRKKGAPGGENPDFLPSLRWTTARMRLSLRKAVMEPVANANNTRTGNPGETATFWLPAHLKILPLTIK